jgi:RNA polymerase sigma-70 factor (ECF subfamily)
LYEGTVEDRPPQEIDFTSLFEENQTIAFRTAWLITGSAAEAEEAAQTAFIKAHRALDRFDPGRPFRPWLLKIVANEARNRRVSEARRERLVLRVAAEERRPGGAVPAPEAALLDSERRAAVLEALGGLPARDRDVIACRYLLELSEAETAAALKIRRGTVKSRLARALERLRREVGDA